MRGVRTVASIGLLALPGCLLTDSLSSLTGGASSGDGGARGVDSGVDAGLDAARVDGAPADAGSDAAGDAAGTAPIQFVQVAANSTTTATFTLPLPRVGAHHALIVAAHVASPATLSAVTDSAGQSFQQVVGPAPGPSGNHYVLATYDTKAGDDVVTVTASAAASPFEGYAAEYAGLATSMAFDQANSMNGTSMALDGMTSGPVTTTAPNELLFGFGEARTTAAGTGFTARSLYNGNVVEDRVVSTAGIYAATATETSSTGSWTMIVATFKGR